MARFFFLCLIITAFFQPSVNAVEDAEIAPWYEVEMLVFALNGQFEQEQWLPLDDLFFPDKVALLVVPSTTTDAIADEAYWLSEPRSEEKVPYRLLPRGQRSGDIFFTEALSKFAENRRYRVLFHERWEQPVLSRNNALPVLIEGGQVYGDYRELMGTVQLGISRYLHLKADLWLTDYVEKQRRGGNQPLPPLPPRGDPEEEEEQDSFKLKARNIANNIEDEVDRERSLPGAVRSVRINERRRMRSNEVHYLDHPLFGIFIRVLPPEETDD